MGSSGSKPSPAPSHAWKSETPVRFSQDMIDSLQSSSENDSTRAKDLELHIQARVAEELSRLQEKSTQSLKEISEKLSAPSEEGSSGGDKDNKKKEGSSSSNSGQSDGDKLRQLGRESVQRDIDGLRKKLEARKKVADADSDVEAAKSTVIKCLRDNDRRPLDCWKEVETFKMQVKRMEERWVEKIVR